MTTIEISLDRIGRMECPREDRWRAFAAIGEIVERLTGLAREANLLSEMETPKGNPAEMLASADGLAEFRRLRASTAKHLSSETVWWWVCGSSSIRLDWTTNRLMLGTACSVGLHPSPWDGKGEFAERAFDLTQPIDALGLWTKADRIARKGGR